MAYHNFIVCDFETGGFDPNENPITEGAFIAVHGATLKSLGSYENLVQPYDDLVIEQAAQDMTGLTPKILTEQGVSIDVFVKDLCDFFARYKQGKYRKPIIVAQNAGFEMNFLQAIFARQQLNVFDYIDTVPFCTLRSSMQKWPNEPVHKLINICQRIGIQHIDAHRAMKDTQVTVDVFKYLVAQLRQDTEISIESNESSIRNTFKFQLG